MLQLPRSYTLCERLTDGRQATLTRSPAAPVQHHIIRRQRKAAVRSPANAGVTTCFEVCPYAGAAQGRAEGGSYAR